MKFALISTTAFLIFAAPAFSDLTVKDLDKIGSIVKESENSVKEHVDLKVKNVSDKVDEMDKRLNYIFLLVIALIGIPQIVIAWRGKQQKELAAKIDELQQEVGTLKQERLAKAVT